MKDAICEPRCMKAKNLQVFMTLQMQNKSLCAFGELAVVQNYEMSFTSLGVDQFSKQIVRWEIMLIYNVETIFALCSLFPGYYFTKLLMVVMKVSQRLLQSPSCATFFGCNGYTTAVETTKQTSWSQPNPDKSKRRLKMS